MPVTLTPETQEAKPAVLAHGATSGAKPRPRHASRALPPRVKGEAGAPGVGDP